MGEHIEVDEVPPRKVRCVERYAAHEDVGLRAVADQLPEVHAVAARMCVQLGDNLAEVVRVPDVIRVQVRNDLAGAFDQTEVPRGPMTHVLRPQVANACVLCAQSLPDGWRVVRASVVDY